MQIRIGTTAPMSAALAQSFGFYVEGGPACGGWHRATIDESGVPGSGFRMERQYECLRVKRGRLSRFHQ